jgi:archaellum biogenesis ATPase FlaH/stress-induced morphogen
MYRKDVNERSPMRVFEKSMHGGLGRGNVGVVASRAGVGKTPLLVQIALDDLLRDRKVLHISHEHAVDHVRAYYDEIFHDLSVVSKLDDPEAVKLDVERHRLIYSHVTQAISAPPSNRGGRSSIGKILDTVTFARDVAHFEPDVIIIDGFDFHHATEDAIKALGALARERSIELWLSANTDAPPEKAGEIPAPIDRFAAYLNVVVFLAPERDVVRLRLLKDHDSKAFGDLHLRLDPHSMRIIDEDVPPPSERPKNPRRFRLLSGGAKGAEAEFGACAERWGMTEVHYSFEGHTFLQRARGVVKLTEEELKKGDFSLIYVGKRLNRVLSEIPLVRNVLQTIWHQINGASQVFVIGAIQADNTVRGGTGWGAELARLWKKPLFVFDQAKRSWFRWSGTAWEIAPQPVIGAEAFAGIGTQNLTDDGREAIRDLFRRSFGDPSA